MIKRRRSNIKTEEKENTQTKKLKKKTKVLAMKTTHQKGSENRCSERVLSTSLAFHNDAFKIQSL